MNSKQLFQDFVSSITRTDREEAKAIAYLVFEKLLGVSTTDILSGKNLPDHAGESLLQVSERLNANVPVQYILGEADFFGRKFEVTPSVLIPRPETEELVMEVIRFSSERKDSSIRIVDIGTGSGCIPITLALEIKPSEVFATDISSDALAVAKGNSEKLKSNVNFLQHDILTQELPWIDFDVVVSNPPYIALSERASMSDHVVNYEPHLALFVSDDDPLIFYRVIAECARKVLRPGGLLIVEINERFGNEVKTVISGHGFINVKILKDLSGKERIVLGKMP